MPEERPLSPQPPAKPVLQALVLADHVYIDAKTSKKVIAGTFNHLAATEFPSNFGRTTFAFLSLTEVHGTVLVNLRFVDLSNNNPLLEISSLAIHSNDPLATVEMVVECPPFPMPHAGIFAFEACVGEEILGSLRVFVSRAEDRIFNGDHDEEGEEESEDEEPLDNQE